MQKTTVTVLGDEAKGLQIVEVDLEGMLGRNKVVLEHFVISFLLQGHKLMNFAGSDICINSTQALVIAQGNCLVTGRGRGSENYNSILFFFSRQRLTDFLVKRGPQPFSTQKQDCPKPWFVFEQDDYIKTFVSSLSVHLATANTKLSESLLAVKFEEVMTYLLDKYGDAFLSFLSQGLKHGEHLPFKQTVEANKYNNLSVSELAFLCNMSLSTFKRHFVEIFNETPGNWLKQQRLERAKSLLESGASKPSQIFTATGYKNHSHFSTAFKAKFGKAPSQSS